MASRKREASFARQAALDSLVRFGPEMSGLQALMKQAYDDRATGRAQARGTARSTISAVDEARPGVKKIYDDAGLAAAHTAKTLVGSDVAHLGGVADSIKAASQLEQAAGANRLQEDQSSALTDLSRRRVAAVEGRGFALKNTQREFVSTVAKILDRSQALAQEKGAFAASETGKLRQAAADQHTKIKIATAGNQQSERNSLRSAGIDPDTGAPIPGGKLDPKAKQPKRFDATHSDYKQASAQIGQALSALRTLDPERDRTNRRDLGQLLLQGHKSQPVYTTDASGKRVQKLTKAGTPVTTPDVPQVDQVFATAALDMYYNGGISRGTLKKLHALGYKINRLPVTPARPGSAPPRPKSTGGIFGQVLSQIGG